MKIIYLGQFANPFSDTTERHIKYSFEKLGHQVIPISEEYFHQERNRVLEEIYYENADLFFFHKGGWRKKVHPRELADFLTYVTCKKAFWFFDKIADLTMETLETGPFLRQAWMDIVLPFVDYGFVTDGTFVRRTNYRNLYLLRQGIGDQTIPYKGQFRPEYNIKVAFLGRVYGERERFVRLLKREFGRDFEVFNNIFGKELKDFCASAKIIVAPLHPADDYYWSSRIYQVLGNGGFLIHPRCEGLKEEFEDGKHYVSYHTYPDLIRKIRYYLEHEDERKKIQKAGYEHCIKNYTYTYRVKKMLEIIEGKT